MRSGTFDQQHYYELCKRLLAAMDAAQAPPRPLW